MDKLGFGYEDVKGLNPRLIYCSEKGFLSGPYEHRTALDEVTQMMGGLAYMTGPPGRPLRAGTSVVDVTGGMFGRYRHFSPLFVSAAKRARGKEKDNMSNPPCLKRTAFLVGQHMAQECVTGAPAQPSARAHYRRGPSTRFSTPKMMTKFSWA